MKLITKQTYSIFWKHLKSYKPSVFIAVFSIIATSVLSIIIPLYYKRFFDLVSGASPGQADIVGQLINVIITVLLLQVSIWIFFRIANYYNIYLQARVMADMANTYFSYLHSHSYGFFANKFVGALVRKVNRLIDAFEGIADKVLWDFLPIITRVFAIIIVLFYQNPVIALIMLGWVLVYTILNYAFTLYKLKYDEENARVDTRVTAQLADTITGSTNIKLFSASSDEARWFRRLTEEQYNIRRFVWSLDEYSSAIQSGFMITLEFAVFFVAIRFWNNGLLSIGDFVLIQVYLVQLFDRLWDFGRVVRKTYEHLANAEEMVEILNTPHEIQDKPMAKKLVVTYGSIEFKDVSFTYTKTREVMKNFNLHIAPGEKVGLVGPSGAGKSTLISLLLRLFDVHDGAVLIDGKDISNVTQESLRRSIAMVPQDPILFHRSLRENIRYGRRSATNKEMLKAAKLAHCDDFIKRLPEGYETFVGERGIKLSGGERQRVAIARAILKNAPILLLDEATSSLDSHSESLIQDALANLMKGKTTIVIAHRLSTIMKMDRILVMEKGHIIEIGTHNELTKKTNGIYRGLWELQAGGFIK